VTTKEACADDRSATHGHRIAARRCHLHATSSPLRPKPSDNADLLPSLDEPMLLVDEGKRAQDPFPILPHGFATVNDLLVDQNGVIPLDVGIETVSGGPQVASVECFKARTNDLHVLLRHRPPSIPLVGPDRETSEAHGGQREQQGTGRGGEAYRLLYATRIRPSTHMCASGNPAKSGTGNPPRMRLRIRTLCRELLAAASRHASSKRARRLFGLELPSLAREGVSARRAAEPLARALRNAARHGRGQQRESSRPGGAGSRGGGRASRCSSTSTTTGRHSRFGTHAGCESS
jgi:hypothetical protein